MDIPETIIRPFVGPNLPDTFRWHCPPSSWSLDASTATLHIAPDAPTDFWQRTHYGFRVDSGHFLHTEIAGDFVLAVRVGFRPVWQYDQAGLMVRVGADDWLKTSVEYEPDGPARLGAVVTNFGYSDWSTQPFPSGDGVTWLRVRREGDDYIVDASPDGRAWMQIRVAHLHGGRGAPVACGAYACSPKGRGFTAEFSQLEIMPGRVDNAKKP